MPYFRIACDGFGWFSVAVYLQVEISQYIPFYSTFSESIYFTNDDDDVMRNEEHF